MMNKTKISSVAVLTALISTTTVTLTAQVAKKAAAAPPPAEDFTWWYIMLVLLGAGLAGAVMWSLKNKKAEKQAAAAAKVRPKENGNAWEIDAVDGDKELEWLRKNQKLVGKKEKTATARKKRVLAPLPSEIKARAEAVEAETVSETPVAEDAAFLPIFSIRRLELARPYEELPLSNDDSLMDAIEQTQDESEEDSDVRELSVRILAAFKTRNSVEALSQVALYDLLANLRSKAVSTLSEFDHESVFEPILLTCADPTREVRAAAARGLTKLTFDRADAWTRIAELDAEGRIVAAARAAIESGFVDMSFDRLVHQDRKYAYEAFALMALLIKAGETEKLFDALETHRNPNVRKAVLHIIKITKNPEVLEELGDLLKKETLPLELQEEIDKTIEEIGYVTA